MALVKMKDLDGKEFLCTPVQREALESLAEARQGGIAAVYGYMPATNVIVPPVQDMQIITRFNTSKLYERKMLALSEIRFSDVADAIEKEPKLKALPVHELLDLFNTRKAMLVSSMNTTLEGDRSDAHRQGHDRCYARIADGLKVHYVTETNKADGLKYPVLDEETGLPVVASIMLHYLELNKTVRKEGEYKKVNSGAPVLMGNAIESVLNKRSVGLKTLSLKEGNFERLVVARKSYLPEEVASYGDILNG